MAVVPDGAREKRPRHVALVIPEGGGVDVSGTVTWRDEPSGILKLDVLTLTEGKPPELIHQSTLALALSDDGGPFTLTLPADLGDVHLVAYVDRNDNGPSAGESTGTRRVHVGGGAISDIALVLAVGTELGRLAPGAPPPADAGPPPEDNSGIVAGTTQAAAGR